MIMLLLVCIYNFSTILHITLKVLSFFMLNPYYPFSKYPSSASWIIWVKVLFSPIIKCSSLLISIVSLLFPFICQVWKSKRKRNAKFLPFTFSRKIIILGLYPRMTIGAPKSFTNWRDNIRFYIVTIFIIISCKFLKMAFQSMLYTRLLNPRCLQIGQTTFSCMFMLIVIANQ